MTYPASEVSVHDAKPVELFKFEGTYANFFYTSGPKEVVFEGDTYVPIYIVRSDVRTGTQDDDGLDLKLDVPATSTLAQTYGFTDTPPELDLTVYRFHRGAMGDYVRYWSGPVTSITTNEGISTVLSPSALAHALVGEFPNVYFQTPCNDILGDERCGVDLPGDWTVVTTATIVDGREITVATVGTLGGKLVGGELGLPSGERRMITAQVGTLITVNFPFSVLVPATAVSLVVGCDHAWEGDCKLVFNNQPRFGGFPFGTNENVFSEGIEPGYTCPDGTCLPFVPVFADWYARARVELVDPSTPLPPGLGFVCDPSGGALAIDHADIGATWPGTSNADYPGGIPYVDVDGDGEGMWLYWCNENVLSSTEIDLVLQFPAASVDPDMKARFSFQRWYEDTGAVGYLTPKATSTVIDPGDPSADTADPFDVDSLFPQHFYFDI